MSKTNHCKEIGMNNQMIRVLSLALCLVMVLGLTACGRFFSRMTASMQPVR